MKTYVVLTIFTFILSSLLETERASVFLIVIIFF